VHGANRLGSISLLDIIVFGRARGVAGRGVDPPGEGHVDLPNESTDRPSARLDRIRWSKGKTGAGAIPVRHAADDAAATVRSSRRPLLDEG